MSNFQRTRLVKALCLAISSVPNSLSWDCIMLEAGNNVCRRGVEIVRRRPEIDEHTVGWFNITEGVWGQNDRSTIMYGT